MSGYQKGKVASFFGQFSEPQFYVELAQTAIREVIKAAALAFAGALTLHVQSRFKGVGMDTSYQPNNPQNPNNAASAASRAFGVQDTTNYKPSYNPSVSAGAQSFPGFGQR